MISFGPIEADNFAIRAGLGCLSFLTASLGKRTSGNRFLHNICMKNWFLCTFVIDDRVRHKLRICKVFRLEPAQSGKDKIVQICLADSFFSMFLAGVACFLVVLIRVFFLYAWSCCFAGDFL